MRNQATQPRLYLISRPALVAHGLRSFLKDHSVSWSSSENVSDAEHCIEICGRVCYMSFSEDKSRIRHPNAKYVANLIDKGHESVLEHANWTFILDYVSRAFTHQLVRHRVGFSFSQLSQQYHDEGQAKFVRPAGLNEEAHAIWEESTKAALKKYRELLSSVNASDDLTDAERLRLRRSAARSILPNATMTTISVTANARALRDFLTKRGSISGDIEMRLVSKVIFEMLRAEAPSLVFDFKLEVCDNGWPLVMRTE
jgi:thymidylate synthase (FAD)